MSETCKTCGQELPDGDTNLSVLIRDSCNDISQFAEGWDAVWTKWSVGETKFLGDDKLMIEKVFETNWEDLDGYDTLPIEMVFQVARGYDSEFWKICGEWDSYDGKKWNGMFVKVEKKERTSVYYG